MVRCGFGYLLANVLALVLKLAAGLWRVAGVLCQIVLETRLGESHPLCERQTGVNPNGAEHQYQLTSSTCCLLKVILTASPEAGHPIYIVRRVLSSGFWAISAPGMFEFVDVNDTDSTDYYTNTLTCRS